MINLRVAYDQESDVDSEFHPDSDFSWNVTTFDKSSM